MLQPIFNPIVDYMLKGIYDDSTSLLEFVAKLHRKLNEVIDEINLKLPDDFEDKFYQKLRDYTKDEIAEVVASGEFLTILTSILSGVEATHGEVVAARNGELTLDAYLTQITGSITDLETTTVSNMDALETELTGLINAKPDIDDFSSVTSELKSVAYKGMIAHRGFQAKAPENTVKAIREAGRAGFVCVELDPRKTSDGVWVLMHDANVDRTTNGTGYITGLTIAQIKSFKVDVPSGLIDPDEVITVPTLEEALQECAVWGMGVNFDGTKISFDETTLTQLRDLLKKYNLLHNSFLICPTWQNRFTAQEFVPDLKIGWVSTPTNVAQDLIDAAEFSSVIVGYEANTLSDATVALYNVAGIDLMVYSADTITDVYKWINKGVRYIETDIILPGGEM